MVENMAWNIDAIPGEECLWNCRVATMMDGFEEVLLDNSEGDSMKGLLSDMGSLLEVDISDLAASKQGLVDHHVA